MASTKVSASPKPRFLDAFAPDFEHRALMSSTVTSACRWRKAFIDGETSKCRLGAASHVDERQPARPGGLSHAKPSRPPDAVQPARHDVRSSDRSARVNLCERTVVDQRLLLPPPRRSGNPKEVSIAPVPGGFDWSCWPTRLEMRGPIAQQRFPGRYRCKARS